MRADDSKDLLVHRGYFPLCFALSSPSIAKDKIKDALPKSADLDIYVSAYSAPGAMRAGFEVYRAFDRDVEDNREVLRRNGKLTVPVLAVFAAVSNSGPLVEEMMREVAETVTGLRISASAHWIAEENPSEFTEGLLKFLR